MRLSGVQQYTMIDYPGKIACVVFTAGCNLRCPYCHNPESVLPELIKQQKDMMIDDEVFFSFLKTRKGLLDGVSICGGEPTLQPDLRTFARHVKELGFLVKLDTNGRDADLVIDLIDEGTLDYVAVDIKHTPQRYEEAVGRQTNQHYRDNYERLRDALLTNQIDYEYRTTLIQGVHDQQAIEQMAAYIEGAKAYYLQTYRSAVTLDPTFAGRPYSEDQMQQFQTIAAPYVDYCAVRT